MNTPSLPTPDLHDPHRRLPRTESPRSVIVAGLAALALAVGVARFASAPLLPMMMADAGLSGARGGVLAAANYLAYLAGALIAMTGRVAPRTGVRAGLVLVVLSTVAMGCTDRYGIWIVLRGTAGFASAWLLIFVAAWALRRLAAYGMSAAKGWVFAGVGIGMIAVGLLCLVFMQLGTSSAHAWVMLGVVALVAIAAMRPVIALRSPAPAAHPGAGEPRELPASNTTGHLAAAPVPLRWRGEPLRLVLCYGAAGFAYIMPATFLPMLAKQAVSDPRIFGLSWPLFGLAAAVSTVVAARLHVRFANRRLWLWSNLLMAAGVVLPVFSSSMSAIIASALLVGGTFMVITMAGFEEARLYSEVHASRLIAALTASFATGQAAGPLLVSYCLDAGRGMAPALWAAAAALLLAAAGLSRPPVNTER